MPFPWPLCRGATYLTGLAVPPLLPPPRPLNSEDPRALSRFAGKEHLQPLAVLVLMIYASPPCATERNSLRTEHKRLFSTRQHTVRRAQPVHRTGPGEADHHVRRLAALSLLVREVRLAGHRTNAGPRRRLVPSPSACQGMRLQVKRALPSPAA